MGNPRTILSKVKVGPLEESPQEEASEPAINELVEKVFTTRNLVHFAHWNTNSFAQHMALGDLYDQIVEDVDNIVETYQGEFGLLKGLETDSACLEGDIIARIKGDSDWIKANRTAISNGSSTIQNLLDSLTNTYNRTLYKLNNLH